MTSSDNSSADLDCLVLGIDGATWDIVEPLVDAGTLPTFERLMTEGATGSMESTFPPVTGPAWLSMATGKNPGKTGVFDFLIKDDDGVSDSVISSKEFRRNDPFWDILNEESYRTHLLNYPMLYPYYDVDGVMVGGIGIPDGAPVASPPSLESSLQDLVGTYPTTVSWNAPRYHGDTERFLEDIHAFIDKQFRAVHHVLDSEGGDLAVHVSSASDFVQHVMWADWIDESSPYHKDFLAVWEELDERVGALLDAHPETNVILVSDHGFGPVDQQFRLGKWLLENGYLERQSFHRTRKQLTGVLQRLYDRLKDSPAVSKVVDLEQVRESSVTDSLNVGVSLPPEIDIDVSEALPGYASAAHGAIHVANGNESTRQQIINDLQQMADRYGFDLETFSRTDRYEGNAVDRAPDILFRINDHRCHIQAMEFEGETFETGQLPGNKTGSHRMEGIFCAHGPDMASGVDLGDVRIFDIAPTLLHLFDAPIPDDVDGEVLTAAFAPDSDPRKRSPRWRMSRDERTQIERVVTDLVAEGTL